MHHKHHTRLAHTQLNYSKALVHYHNEAIRISPEFPPDSTYRVHCNSHYVF